MNPNQPWENWVLTIIFGLCVIYIIRRVRSLFSRKNTAKSKCHGCSGGSCGK